MKKQTMEYYSFVCGRGTVRHRTESAAKNAMLRDVIWVVQLFGGGKPAHTYGRCCDLLARQAATKLSDQQAAERRVVV